MMLLCIPLSQELQFSLMNSVTLTLFIFKLIFFLYTVTPFPMIVRVYSCVSYFSCALLLLMYVTVGYIVLVGH